MSSGVCAGLERRGCEVDAGVEHAVEERPEALDVSLGDMVEASYDGFVGEHETEHAACTCDGERYVRVVSGAFQAVDE